MRESPALEIVHALQADGYDIVHYDPLVEKMGWQGTLAEACAGADLLAVLIGHDVVLKELESTRPAVEASLRNNRILVFG
jgi:UDP-N-acetyl-D-mannosaminuronate dehydrogenase